MASAIDGVGLREGGVEDWPAIAALLDDAFPDEDLKPLVRAQLQDASTLAFRVAFRLAEADRTLVGMVGFSACRIDGFSGRTALLGPLAVASERQRQGVGSALVRDGAGLLQAAGVARIYVLGNPAYYSRFGFAPETDVLPPHPIPVEWRDAWARLVLAPDPPPPPGVLRLAALWDRPELWSP